MGDALDDPFYIWPVSDRNYLLNLKSAKTKWIIQFYFNLSSGASRIIIFLDAY